MRMHLAVCVLVLLLEGATAAQDRPDFSGTWTLVNPIGSASSAAHMLIVRQSFTRESVRGTPIDPPLITLAVERHASASVHSDLYTIGVIGGTVSGVGGQSAQTRFSTTWDADRLVIETVYSGRPGDAGSSSIHREVWSLDAQQTLSLVFTDQSTDTEPMTTTLIYRRQP
jgi:hypothetical protein